MADDCISHLDAISALYQVALSRAPDLDGFQTHLTSLRSNGFSRVLADFLNSPEFKARSSNGSDATINWHSTMKVSLDCDEQQRALLWKEVEDAWEHLGEDNPFWSVLSDEAYRGKSLEKELETAFYASGSTDVAYLQAFADRCEVKLPVDGTVIEYGCGLGRVTGYLCEIFGQVRAFDISRPHLAVAEQHLLRKGMTNIDWIHTKTRADLKKMIGADLFFSMIVLQHSPPPIIHDVLKAAFEGLNVGGLAFFQVPTYSTEYSFSPSSYLHSPPGQRGMEMHFIPQRAIFSLASEHNMRIIEVRHDHCVGNYNRFISNTFFLQKTA